MKKTMLMLGMIGGGAITYMMLNKNTRKMMIKKMDCMLKEADKMLDDSIN